MTLNGELKAAATANTPNMTVSFGFKDGDVLRISEDKGVVVVNDIRFDCSAEAGECAGYTKLDHRAFKVSQELKLDFFKREYSAGVPCANFAVGLFISFSAAPNLVIYTFTRQRYW